MTIFERPRPLFARVLAAVWLCGCSGDVDVDSIADSGPRGSVDARPPGLDAPPARDDGATAPSDAPVAPPGDGGRVVPPPLAELPDWVDALAIGEWTAIPDTSLSSVDPSPLPAGATGPQSKVIAWTSFVVDPRDSTVYSPANGGHGDYSGNEVDALELEHDPPRWVERRAPTAAAQVRDGAYYDDGAPTSRHTYYGLTFDVERDRIMLFTGARWQNGYALPTTDSFDVAASAWLPAGTHPDVPDAVSGLPGYPFVHDPSTDDVYVLAGYDVVRWSASGNEWITERDDDARSSQYALSALDTLRGRVLVVGGDSAVHYVYELASREHADVTLGGAAAGAIAGASQDAMLYVPEIDRFLVRLSGAGGTIYQIAPDTFEATAWPTSGGGAIPETINGVWRRFLYVPRLHGCVYVPEHDGPVWFVRVR
jgi:hypothetical protein